MRQDLTGGWRVFALCGDCLQVHDVDRLVPDDNSPPGRCPDCGGDCCSCEGCMARLLGLTVEERQRILTTPGAYL